MMLYSVCDVSVLQNTTLHYQTEKQEHYLCLFVGCSRYIFIFKASFDLLCSILIAIFQVGIYNFKHRRDQRTKLKTRILFLL